MQRICPIVLHANQQQYQLSVGPAMSTHAQTWLLGITNPAKPSQGVATIIISTAQPLATFRQQLLDSLVDTVMHTTGYQQQQAALVLKMLLAQNDNYFETLRAQIAATAMHIVGGE